MTAPRVPDLDLTLARCPHCAHEALEIVGDEQEGIHTLRLLVRCALCSHASDLGYVTRHSKYLFPWVLSRWGVQSA